MSKAVTYTTRNFAVKITEQNGVRGISFEHALWLQHELKQFKVGEICTLYITSKRPKRTIQQNRYWRGVYLPMIMEDRGWAKHDAETLHQYFCGLLLTDRIDFVHGDPVRVERRSHDLTVGEFCEFIAGVYEKTNIMPPDTQDFNFPKVNKVEYPVNDLEDIIL